MSQPSTSSQPQEPHASAPSRVPPPPAEALATLADTVRRLRAEVAAATDGARQARLLTEIGEAQERAGDEAAATRDYLAAYSADATFREPLEGVVRLLEKRRSLKNLGRLVDPMVKAATEPGERVRALLMKAAYVSDVAGLPADAIEVARAATEIEDAPAAERATAWLALELLAGRTGDPVARDLALGERSKFAADPAWRALLLVDRARSLASAGDVDGALSLLEEARSLGVAGHVDSRIAQIEVVLAGPPGHRRDRRGPQEGRSSARTPSMRWRAPSSRTRRSTRQRATRSASRRGCASRRAWSTRGCAPRTSAGGWAASTSPGRCSTAPPARTFAAQMTDEDRRLAAGLVAARRLLIADQLGDTEQAASIAEGRLATEADPGRRAALAAWASPSWPSPRGDPRPRSKALARAIEGDPGSLPARALQLDLLADGSDASAFASCSSRRSPSTLGIDEGRARAASCSRRTLDVRGGRRRARS